MNLQEKCVNNSAMIDYFADFIFPVSVLETPSKIHWS